MHVSGPLEYPDGAEVKYLKDKENAVMDDLLYDNGRRRIGDMTKAAGGYCSLSQIDWVWRLDWMTLLLDQKRRTYIAV